MANNWTWAVYGPKTIGLGCAGGSGAEYLVNTRYLRSNDIRVQKDMITICKALTAASKSGGKKRWGVTAKNDGYMALYKAVAKYVEKHGGAVVVAGGIQLQQMPGDNDSTFYVAVKCTGRKPIFEGKERP